ncbi:MAG TPA: hypothetical protein VEC36_01785 [Patescibacteria group bacterium]|nr:hypothetical protein [Patescibacteria group bacterium]
MKKILSESIATKGMLTIFSLTIIFHILVLVGVIPFGIVWGGRLQDRNQMLIFETVSIIINVILLCFVAIQAGMVNIPIRPSVLKKFFWAMCTLFMLNTIGNLFSVNSFEKAFFTPITLLLAVFSWRLAVSDPLQKLSAETLK